MRLLPILLLLFGSTATVQQPPRDERRISAQNTFAEAEQLSVQQTADSERKAIAKYEAALSLYHDLAEQNGEALTLTKIGRAYDALSEKQKALGYYNRALTLYRALDERIREAEALLFVS